MLEDSFLNSTFNILEKLEKIKINVDDEVKSAEDRLGSDNECLKKKKNIINSAYSKAGDEISKCIGDKLYHITSYMPERIQNLIVKFQEPALNIPFIMLTDLSKTNPITQSNKFIEEIWPASIRKIHDNIYGQLSLAYNSNLSYKGLINNLPAGLSDCFKGLEESFISTKDSILNEINTEC